MTPFPILLALGLVAGGWTVAQTDEPAAVLPAPAPVTAPEPSEAPAAVRAVDGPTFVQRAMMGNDFEIGSSRIALDRSTDEGVRGFARRMIADHEAAARRLGELVARSGIGADATGAVTPTPPAHADVLNRLNEASGPVFDRLYLEAQAEAHQEAIRLYTAYAETGDDARLRDFAVSTLPTLQEHQHAIAELMMK